MSEPTKEVYIGDGVYVSAESLCEIKLRAPRENGDHEIYLDLDMINALCDFLRKKLRFDVRQQ